MLPAAVNPDCKIKGNISINTGERIYHVPGQRYYADTIIRREYVERWFCSEADARAAGWRKSGIDFNNAARDQTVRTSRAGFRDANFAPIH